jgi:hypothetical protein
MRNDLLAYSITFLLLALAVLVLVLVLILLRSPILLFILLCFIVTVVPFTNAVILFLILNRYKKIWISNFLFPTLSSLLIVIFILIYGFFIQPIISGPQYFSVMLFISKLLNICIFVILCTQIFISILVCIHIQKKFAFVTLFAQSIFLISLVLGGLFFSDLIAGL